MTAAADVRRDSSTPRCDAPAVRRPCACHVMDFPGKNSGISWFLMLGMWELPGNYHEFMVGYGDINDESGE